MRVRGARRDKTTTTSEMAPRPHQRHQLSVGMPHQRQNTVPNPPLCSPRKTSLNLRSAFPPPLPPASPICPVSWLATVEGENAYVLQLPRVVRESGARAVDVMTWLCGERDVPPFASAGRNFDKFMANHECFR